MDELDVGGKKYISSKRASELTGYAKDYIGQLLRAGKVPGTRFGRAWYVEESEILRHAGKTSVPEASEPTPVSSEIVAVPQAPKAVKPLLSHHMITPAALPKTWSNIQYLEDTSELFPVVIPRTTEVTEAIPARNVQKISDDVVPVSITRNRVSVEKRVANLVDGIRPRSAMLRVAQTSVSVPRISVPVPLEKAVPRVVSAGPVMKKVSVLWSADNLVTTFAILILVFGSFISFSVIKNVSLGNPEVLTAATIYGLTDFLDLLKDARILEGGLDAISSFYTLLKDSFAHFIRLAWDFIVGLF